MPNAIGANGLTIATKSELTTTFNTAAEQIYGSDINLDPDSPDGQMIGIFLQAVLDALDLIQSVNASFDPDQAVGAILDQRVAINGIQRQAGTFTVTNITVVVSAAITLYGLDQTAQPVYTIADNAGTQWQLQTTQLISGSGTYIYAFQAATPGAVLSVQNTITVPVTIVIGVTSVNNPTSYTTLGIVEESDAALKIRRQKSVALASQGYLAGLYAALLNISGVTYAYVEENNTGSTNADGVTGHSIWVIVAGSGLSSAIANAIYTKRNAGCGMVGAQTYNVTQLDGSVFTISWDIVTQINLFMTYTLAPLGTTPPNAAAIIATAGLPTTLAPTVYGQVNINELSTLVQEIDANTMVTSAGFTTALTQIFVLSGTAASGTFKFGMNGTLTAAINWNDSGATIQSKMRAVAGMTTVVVTGTIGGLTLTIAMGTTLSAAGLIYVSTNSLQTAGAAAITFAANYGYANSLFPALKKNQFAVTAGGMVMLPIVLTCATATTVVTGGAVVVTLSIAHGGTTATFGVTGGYGAMVYSMQSGAGAINSSTGVYTSSTAGSDVVLVTDVLGNQATCAVTVT